MFFALHFNKCNLKRNIVKLFMLEIPFQLPTASVYLSGQIKTYRCILIRRTTKESEKGFKRTELNHSIWKNGVQRIYRNHQIT